jgi:chemotaxis protein MotA
MDFATIVGLLLANGLILTAIFLGGSIVAYVDLPSFLIVVGGTAAATLVMERAGNVKAAFKVAMNAVRNPDVGDATRTIKLIVKLAQIARKDGLLGLENEKIDDPFLARGLRMAIDGVAVEDVVAAMQVELSVMKMRHLRGQKFFKFVASMAPAMGMIGTLVGLVQMLQNLSDPASIGPAMAVALLTTLYGAIIANVFASPIAEKLARRSAEQSANMMVAIDGIEAIVKGIHPSMVQERLIGHLEPKARKLAAEPAKSG